MRMRLVLYEGENEAEAKTHETEVEAKYDP